MKGECGGWVAERTAYVCGAAFIIHSLESVGTAALGYSRAGRRAKTWRQAATFSVFFLSFFYKSAVFLEISGVNATQAIKP